MNSVSILFSWHKNLGRVIKLVLGETNRTGANFELTSVSGKKYVIDRFIYLHCLKCVLVNATCEREIFKLFKVSKCKGFYSFKLEKNTMRKILKLNIFHLVEKIVRFLVDCGPQIRIALFTNMRILEFRSQPTIAFFAAVTS